MNKYVNDTNKLDYFDFLSEKSIIFNKYQSHSVRKVNKIEAKTYLIRTWQERFKEAKEKDPALNQRIFSKEAGIAYQSFNLILNNKRRYVKDETVRKVEKAFEKRGV